MTKVDISSVVRNRILRLNNVQFRSLREGKYRLLNTTLCQELYILGTFIFINIFVTAIGTFFIQILKIRG